eukprot:3482657-Ditylum_brightwellii.AAC.1
MHMEGSWIPHLCTKVQKIDATIKTVDVWTLQLQHEGDKNILDIFVDLLMIDDTQVMKAD